MSGQAQRRAAGAPQLPRRSAPLLGTASCLCQAAGSRAMPAAAGGRQCTSSPHCWLAAHQLRAICCCLLNCAPCRQCPQFCCCLLSCVPCGRRPQSAGSHSPPGRPWPPPVPGRPVKGSRVEAEWTELAMATAERRWPEQEQGHPVDGVIRARRAEGSAGREWSFQERATAARRAHQDRNALGIGSDAAAALEHSGNRPAAARSPATVIAFPLSPRTLPLTLISSEGSFLY